MVKKKHKRRDAEGSQISRVYLDNILGLKRFLSRFLSGHHDIEDLAQEAYLRAYSAERDQPVRSPKAFLFRIARNVALNELARKSRLLTDYIEDSTSLDIEDNGPTPEQHVINQQRLEVFCQAVAVLPPQCRRAFLLRKVYGLSHKEIAAEMGISVSTVEKHIAQGLRRCSAYVRNERRTVDNVSQLPVERIQQHGSGGP